MQFTQVAQIFSALLLVSNAAPSQFSGQVKLAKRVPLGLGLELDLVGGSPESWDGECEECQKAIRQDDNEDYEESSGANIPSVTPPAYLLPPAYVPSLDISQEECSESSTTQSPSVPTTVLYSSSTPSLVVLFYSSSTVPTTAPSPSSTPSSIIPVFSSSAEHSETASSSKPTTTIPTSSSTSSLRVLVSTPTLIAPVFSSSIKQAETASSSQQGATVPTSSSTPSLVPVPSISKELTPTESYPANTITFPSLTSTSSLITPPISISEKCSETEFVPLMTPVTTLPANINSTPPCAVFTVTTTVTVRTCPTALY
ncbi:hypothetical protein NEOLI_002026 [Neolecta irregularis DAH-3]|uniref:Uncharacterized protein n=1 Tax=Neolecta irregularis (strain DAH-3) TaxID=1198029 RepID=A0A1U7LTG9_NEOID|nr:hypothetical protein NEOLI_002026 [Neolecta irregularis DAH-3]|eukprot:OLL25908.1 hypothetical protein NEOLI_002026 [Neolecta irregularis DAH-3]